MKTYRLVALCMAAFLIFPAGLQAADSKPPEAVTAAAAQGLKPWLEKIPASDMPRFGLDPAAPLDSAVLGAPFLVHTISPAALRQYKAGTAVEALITPTKLWYFPVLIAGEPKLILVVDYMDDQWQAVSMGYPALAREWANVTQQWPESKGYHPVLIAVFQAKRHLFTVPEKGASNLTPLAPAGQAGETKSSAPYSSLGEAEAVIGDLIPIVESNIRN